MSRDFFNTQHEGGNVEVDDNFVRIGDDVNLLEYDPTLKLVQIGSGWDINAFDADVIDADMSLILLDKNGKTRMDEDFVFYNNLEGCEGAVRHLGDSRTGAGDGDDEIALVNLHGVPFDVMKIILVLSIYKGDEKQQRLGDVQGAFVRIVNRDTRRELCRYNLEDDLRNSNDTAMIMAELNREGPKWHFKPIGEFVKGGLRKVAMRYDLIIADQ